MKDQRKRAVLLALALLVVVALGVAACGSSDEGSSSGGTSSGTPVKGGTLVVTYQGDPTSLDPARAWEVNSWAEERMVYETLLTYASKPGEAGTEIVPQLATEVPSTDNGGISADGKTYTFHLRPGVKFPAPVDRAVTADDFKFSFERMLKDPEAPTYFYSSIKGVDDFVAGNVKEVEGFKVVDPQTLELTLTKIDPQMLYEIALPFTSVMPKEWVAKYGKGVDRHPFGTGPFVFDHWTSGQEIVFKRNPTYWDAGKPYLDAVTFLLSANPSTALLKLQSDEVDVMGDAVPAADVNRIQADPTWSKYYYAAPQIAYYYVFLNVLEKPFDNLKVRQALNYAVDRSKQEKIMAGQAKALDQIFPEGLPGHQADKTWYTYDPAKAKQLLSEAGYPDGFKTTFYTHNVDPMPKIAQAVQADLKAVGIDAEIKQMDRGTYWDFVALKGSHVPMGMTDWYQDFPDPSDWMPLYTHPVDNGMNSSFWSDPQVDKLYAQTNTMTDQAERIKTFQQIEDIIQEQASSVVLFQPSWTGMYGKNVGGYYYHPLWNLNIADFWKLNGQ